MLAVLAAFLAWHAVGATSTYVVWLLWGVFAVSIAWLAIVTHRLVLTHDWKPRSTFEEFSFRRLAWFIGALLLIGFAVIAITMIVATLAANIVIGPRYIAAGETPPPDPPGEYFEWIKSFSTVIAYFFVGRISLLLPAIAVDRKPSLAEAWRCSRGSSWKLAIIVGALPWILEQTTIVLWREGSSSVEIASLGILTAVFAIVGFVALSLSYYELTHASAPPPTHPPA
jgi:hypothetical protein